VFDADALDAATMQAIAREQNLSETAFVIRSNVADFGVRYFTPAEEIPLAGHPTIATAFALVDTGRVRLTGERTKITLELRVGPIQVDLFATGAKVQRVVMTQLKPKFLSTYPASEVMPIFGLKPDDALGDRPLQTVSTGTPQLMVPVTGHVRCVAPCRRGALRRAQGARRLLQRAPLLPAGRHASWSDVRDTSRAACSRIRSGARRREAARTSGDTVSWTRPRSWRSRVTGTGARVARTWRSWGRARTSRRCASAAGQ
jgi:hypothetical protein